MTRALPNVFDNVVENALKKPQSLVPLLCLLVTSVAWTAFGSYGFGAYSVGGLFATGFAVSLLHEPLDRALRYLALAASVIVLGVAPVNTDTSNEHVLILGAAFLLAIALPTLILWRRKPRIITFKLFPDHFDWVEVFYTLLAVPLAWGVFQLYFFVLSPQVPYNWSLPAEPQTEPLLRLFLGINSVGIWDELFFINVSYAIIRSLFPYLTANLAQSVIYTTVLWTMAFRGVGPLLVYAFAFTQGAMYERSKSLLWVLIVHLIVDYFLFQAIVSAYYPEFEVWWH